MRFFLLIRTWIICTLLAAAAIFFGYQTVEVWSGNDRLEVNEAIQKTPKRQVNRRVTHRRNPRYNVYEVIAQKDLFASDRREKLPEKSPTPSPVKAAQPLDKRFALFGIVINGGEKKALVANLDKKSAKEKAYIWVKVGDKIGTLNVSEIHQRRVRGRKKKKPTEPRTTIIKKQKVKRPAPKG
jgi:hypothetical protein